MYSVGKINIFYLEGNIIETLPFATGSWYITDLCQALQEHGHIMPVKNVLQKTRQSLKSRMGSMNNAYVTQLSEEKVTLTR